MANRLPFVALAVACIAAAGTGGYLASRQNTVPAPAAAQSIPAAQSAPAAAAPSATTPAAPVQETEAVVGDTAPKAPVAETKPVETKSAPARRAEPARREARTTPTTTTARRDQQPPSLTSTWPSSAAQTPAPVPPAGTMPTPPDAPHADAPQEPPHAPEPPKSTSPTFEELVIARDSVIGLQTDNRISSETARVEDRVDAHVTRDVKVGDHVAVPAGSRVIGTVTQVERGGKFKEQARLGVRFHTIVLGDGTRLPISTETIMRVGDAPTNGTAAKIGGGAVGGAILGAILGGAKGAAIGASAGAGAGTAATMAGDRSAVILAPGTPLTPRILSPVTVTIER